MKLTRLIDKPTAIVALVDAFKLKARPAAAKRALSILPPHSL